jgi:hypothetical protein
MQKYTPEISSPAFDYEGGDVMMMAHHNGDYYEVADADAEIALLKAALRWCAENFTLNGRWVNYAKYQFVEPPAELAGVIGEAVKP